VSGPPADASGFAQEEVFIHGREIEAAACFFYGSGIVTFDLGQPSQGVAQALARRDDIGGDGRHDAHRVPASGSRRGSEMIIALSESGSPKANSMRRRCASDRNISTLPGLYVNFPQTIGWSALCPTG
jgi:hypothetical protein